MKAAPFNTIIDAICQRLQDAGIGVWAKAGEDTPTSDVLIVHAWLPDTPDTAIAVTIHGYPTQLPDTAFHSWRVQVRFRAPGSPNEVNALADSVYPILSATHQVWDGFHVDKYRRYNATPMGRDTSGRWERADNYELITH